jgi:hypothetical protein
LSIIIAWQSLPMTRRDVALGYVSVAIIRHWIVVRDIIADGYRCQAIQPNVFVSSDIGLKDYFGRLIPLTHVRSEMTMEWPRMEESAMKKRRVRKGTHSCWECRRRKVRCIFASPEDLVCITCTRRHSRCVSQAVAEDPHWPTPGTTSKETIFRANERDDARSNPSVRAPAPLVDHVDDSSDFAIPTPSSQQISRVCLPGILLRAY